MGNDEARSKLRLGVRNAWEWLNETGRFEAAKEIFAGLDVYNLTGVSDNELRQIIAETEAFRAQAEAV